MYFSAERRQSPATACFWHQSLLRRRRAKSAEGMGVKCIGLLAILFFRHRFVISLHKSFWDESLGLLARAPILVS
jgi:hypothetical protein